ncbi:hypothetical protein [Caulobacter sp. 1776]|uniref:hypothetical protein n=1 Tax=Caulobacter sp. 1776 TaxID=3156420 RepID=UPI00339083E6
MRQVITLAEARTATAGRAALAHEFVGSPQVQYLNEKLKHATGRLDVLEIIEPIIADLSWVKARLAHWMDRIVEDELGLSPGGTTTIASDGLRPKSGFILYYNPLLRVTVETLHARAYRREAESLDLTPSRVVQFSGGDTVTAILAGSAELDVWECDELTEDSELSGIIPVRKATSFTATAASSPFKIDGRRQSYQLASFSDALCIINFTVTTDTLPCTVAVDTETGAVREVAPVHRRDARMLILSSALRQMGVQDREAALSANLRHPSFFVRSQVVREMIALKGVGFLPELRTLLGVETNPVAKRALARSVDFLEQHTGAN